jgi:hypothetical protein
MRRKIQVGSKGLRSEPPERGLIAENFNLFLANCSSAFYCDVRNKNTSEKNTW